MLRLRCRRRRHQVRRAVRKGSFPEAVRVLASRFGLTVPEGEDGKGRCRSQPRPRGAAQSARRGGGLVPRAVSDPRRGTGEAAAEGTGHRRADHRPHSGSATPCGARGVEKRGSSKKDSLRRCWCGAVSSSSGTNSTILDRFRNRLMIPIHRDNGAIVAFGGRAMGPGQQPKYLNSPETPDLREGENALRAPSEQVGDRKSELRGDGRGIFDVAQAIRPGIANVVASSGTALTLPQAKLLKRFASKVVLSFDPDAAGQGAAARTSELLVAEGFQVNVAMLPAGDDPDNFIRKFGGAPTGKTAHLAAISRLPARPNGERVRLEHRRGTARVSEYDARSRSPNPRRRWP